MKKITYTLLIFILSLTTTKALPLPSAIDNLVTADSVILVNTDTNEVVYEKNPDKQQIMASLTKIMTAYTVIEKIPDLNKKITIREEDIAALWGFTCIGLEVGDEVTYMDLLYGTLLHSGADASQALALHTSKTLEEFNDLMNKEAKKLGLRHSNFMDSFGGHDDNVSTAREVARLLSIALENKTFKKIFTTTQKKLSNGLEVVNYSRSIATFHGLDSNVITGNKSGYTPEAGLLLASTANINNTNYILVVMKCDVNIYKSQHILDTYRVYDYLKTQEFKEHLLLGKGTLLKTILVEDGTINSYLAIADKDITANITDEDYKKLKLDYHITDKITPDNKVGDNLGYVDIYIGEQLIDTYNVYLKEEIFAPEKESRIVILFIVTLAFLVLVLISLNIVGIFTRKKKIIPRTNLKIKK